jgi:hypothetical protein
MRLRGPFIAIVCILMVQALLLMVLSGHAG